MVRRYLHTYMIRNPIPVPLQHVIYRFALVTLMAR
jgi:hypothetical protein